MIDPLTTALYLGTGVLVLLAGLFTLLDKRLNVAVLAVTAVVEVITLVQLVVGIVQLASTDRDVNGPVFVAYLVGLVIVLLALMVQPDPWLEIPFLKDTLHFTVS